MGLPLPLPLDVAVDVAVGAGGGRGGGEEGVSGAVAVSLSPLTGVECPFFLDRVDGRFSTRCAPMVTRLVQFSTVYYTLVQFSSGVGVGVGVTSSGVGE